MTPFWKRRNEKVRIQQAVPSFFASIGTDVSVSSPKEARKALEDSKPCIAVLLPSAAVYSDCHGWASALSAASYLVVIGDEREAGGKRLMRAIDGVVFSPVPRRLSSAFMVRTREEALRLIEPVRETYPNVLTLRATEAADE